MRCCVAHLLRVRLARTDSQASAAAAAAAQPKRTQPTLATPRLPHSAPFGSAGWRRFARASRLSGEASRGRRGSRRPMRIYGVAMSTPAAAAPSSAAQLLGYISSHFGGGGDDCGCGRGLNNEAQLLSRRRRCPVLLHQTRICVPANQLGRLACWPAGLPARLATCDLRLATR